MQSPKFLYVYIVKCADGSYYTGITNNIKKRIAEHNDGKDKGAYTYKRRPVELVSVEQFQNYQQAIACEKRIKGWSRKKKEALIENNWELIRQLSACNNSSSHTLFNKNEANSKL